MILTEGLEAVSGIDRRVHGYAHRVTIGTSLLLIAVGAILKYAVTADVSGFDIQTAGVILMLIGILGLILSLLYTFVWSDQAQRRRAASQPPQGYDEPTRRFSAQRVRSHAPKRHPELMKQLPAGRAAVGVRSRKPQALLTQICWRPESPMSALRSACREVARSRAR